MRTQKIAKLLHLLEFHDLLEFPEEKNAFALRFPCLNTHTHTRSSAAVFRWSPVYSLCWTYRLHDPGAADGSLEFLQEEVIFTGQDEGAGEEVTFGRLHAADVLFQTFPMPFQVFHHEVFAAELKQ